MTVTDTEYDLDYIKSPRMPTHANIDKLSGEILRHMIMHDKAITINRGAW